MIHSTPASFIPTKTPETGSVKRKHDESPHGVGAAPLHVAAATTTVPPRDPQMAIDLLRQGGFIVPDDFTLQIPPTTFKGSIEGKMRRANTAAVYALPTRERLTGWQKQDILKAINSSYPTRPVLMSDDSRRAAQGPQGVPR